jgi:nitrogen fixation protein FixH
MARPFEIREFTGWHMLAVVGLFFGIIIAVNGFMAFSALSTWTGLVVQNSYVASQEFNTKLANARAQDEAGWQGGLDYADGRLIFSLTDANQRPIEAEQIHIAVSRPIGVEGDRELQLDRQPDGSYAAEIALDAGVWNFAIIASFAGGPDYEHRARIVVGPGR